MKLLLASDLHAEFHLDHGDALVDYLAPADIAVLAGDIGLMAEGSLEAILTAFSRKYAETVYVPGNHEYYHSDARTADAEIIKLCAGLGNVHVLRDAPVTLGGQRFVGGTLWFPEPAPHVKRYGRASMADFTVIRGFEPWVYQRAVADETAIRTQVLETDVVVTHMIPHADLVTERWQGNPLNPFFVGGVDERTLVTPKLWVYGHTHDSTDRTLGLTRFVCNPFGYARRHENKDFDPNKVVEI